MISDKKKYVLVVDDVGVALLSQVVKQLMFVEIQGVKLDTCEDRYFLSNPFPDSDKVNNSTTEVIQNSIDVEV